jgi:DNA polymerase-3 subunit beta
MKYQRRRLVDATVDAPGTVLVSGRLLAEIASRLPHESVVCELSGTSMSVTSGSSKFSLSTMPVEEYPNLPEVEGVSGYYSRRNEFAVAVSQVAPAASRDDVTPVITGRTTGYFLLCCCHDGDRSLSRGVTSTGMDLIRRGRRGT